MTSPRPAAFINVDELLPRLTVEQVAAFYGVPLPELHRVGAEIRSRCFLLCGRSQETGDRALSIQADHPARQWHCHQYGCGKGGNLVSLCDLLKPGPNCGGRPRGSRFKEIAADVRSMTEGILSAPVSAPATVTPAPPAKPKANVPLARSDNERARGLVELDRKFVVDMAAMPPPASAYFRRRPFLTSAVCRKWRMGYLPRDTGEDKSGGTLRGMVVYPLLSEAGDVLTWFGRDPSHEDKHRQWEAQQRQGLEPEKFHFVKGFHRSLELFGQHAGRLKEPGFRESLQSLGLVLVEGPNDVIALGELGAPAVGLCSNRVSEEQSRKLVRFARQVAGGRIVLMLDCDPEGETGAQQVLAMLAAHCDVRLAWSARTDGGRYRGRQPESLTAEEWEALRAPLAR
jgi:5S rRNA maturation endonuclease (ribonuclease M5)